MDELQEKKLKEILKSEFLPLFVGLRAELKALNTTVGAILSKEPPEVIKAEITNTPEPVREVGVVNLPEIQKVELTNAPEKITEVSVNNVEPLFRSWHKGFAEGLLKLQTFIKKTAADGAKATYKVDIQNPTKFPKEIKVSNLKDIVIPKVEIPTSVKISNYAPSEAIPVILTKSDRKKFYEAFQQMYVGNDVNLQRVIDAINNTGDLTLIETLLAQILAALGGVGGEIKQFFGELNVAGNTEITLTSYLVPLGKTFNLQGVSGEGDDDGAFRIYVDATKIWQGRIAWTTRTVSLEILRKVVAGETIYLKVLNLRPVARNFSGTIYGTEL